MIKKIVVLALILIFLVVFIMSREKKITTLQNMFLTDYSLSITYPKKLIVEKGEGDSLFGYSAGIRLSETKNNRQHFIDFDYSFENNGDDTPSGPSETGADSFPPQAEELIHPLTNEYEKVGEWLGYNLYIEKKISNDGGVIFQEVFPGQITAYMTLLSKDTSRVNYYDRFLINYSTDPNLDNMKTYTKKRKEFIDIVKSMEIKPIQKSE